MENNEEMITIPRAEYEAQKQQILKLEQQVSLLMEAMRLNRHKRFGASSEKTEDESAEQLNFLFNEAEVYAEKTAEEPATVVTAYKRRKKQEYTLNNLPEGVPTELVEHRLEGDDLVCPKCGDTMTEIGKDVVKKLKIIPAKVVVEEHHYFTYACQKCSRESTETPVVKAPKEKNIISGSFATPEAIAHIMTQKFVMGSPLYRQEQELSRQRIPLSRQTMSNWILKAAEDYLMPVYEQLHKELLSRGYFMQMKLRCRFCMNRERKHRVKAICGFTGQVEIPISQWFYMSINQTEVPIIRETFCINSQATYIRTVIPGIIICLKILRWLDAGLMPDGSLMRQ